jgi:hypothetical protein
MRTRFCASALALCLVIALAGCDVPKEVKVLVATSALTAKERASAFAVIRPRCVAKKAEERGDLQKFMKSHGDQLNAQAKALADINAAIEKGSSLKQYTREMIAAEAETAKVRADLFRAVAPRIAANPEVDVWKVDHQAALDAQALTIAKLATLLAKEKPNAPPAQKETDSAAKN